jgi:hypothetical protein
MKLQCPACKQIIKRDMREKISKLFMTKRGYKSYCDQTGRNVFLKEVK